MPTTKPEFEATLIQKILTPLGILSALSLGALSVITSPFRGSSGASTWKSHVGHSIFRNLFIFLSRPQMQFLGDFVGDYKKWCKQNGQKPDIVDLDSGAQVFWMGARDAKYVCLYFHGGGFSMDGGATHILYWRTVQQDLESAGISLSFCYVSYSLVPHEVYPKQLQECSGALQYLLKECQKKPSEILIAGDSAGGNMSLAVLSHLSQPAPGVPEIKINEPLKAVVLVSPWVDFSTHWPSCKGNYYKDIIALKHIKGWSDDYLGNHQSSLYTEPLKAPTEFWHGAKTQKLLCVSGADEVLVDSIDEWVKKYKAANPDTTTYVKAAHEIHVQPILYSEWASHVKTEQGEAITAFLKANL